MKTMTICSTHGIQMASEPTTKATAKAGPAAPRADAGRRPPGSAGGLAATGGAALDPDHGKPSQAGLSKIQRWASGTSPLHAHALEERVAEHAARLGRPVQGPDALVEPFRLDQARRDRRLADALDHRGERPAREPV